MLFVIRHILFQSIRVTMHVVNELMCKIRHQSVANLARFLIEVLTIWITKGAPKMK